jgi:hypothetical protein
MFEKRFIVASNRLLVQQEKIKSEITTKQQSSEGLELLLFL